MSNQKHLKKLGIILMSTIMLSSIAPTNLIANAKTHHASYTTLNNRIRRSIKVLNKKEKRDKTKRNRYLVRKKRNQLVNRLRRNIRYMKKTTRKHKRNSRDVLEKRINRSINPYYLPKSSTQQLKNIPIRFVVPIHQLVHHQNLNQQHIHWIVTHPYKPSHIPVAMRDIRSNNWLSNKLNKISKAQKNKRAKRTVNQIHNNDSQITTNLHNRLDGEEKDHIYANTDYINHLNHENKIINYGLNAHNGAIYNDYMRHLQDIKDFNSATKSGRALQRQANKRTKQVERTIGRNIKRHDTNKEDNYEDKLLDSWATENNSEAQYYAKHLTLNQVLANVHNASKRKAIINEYNNVKKHKGMYNKAKQAYKHRNDKNYHFSHRGFNKYKKNMNEYERLRASKQTAKIIAKERAVYKKAQQAKQEQINAINNQIKQIEQQIVPLQKEYNDTKDKWEDAEGDVQLRNQLHTKMNAIQQQIQQLQNQISKLEDKASKVEDQMINAKGESKKERYRHEVLGNIKTMQNVSHPNYVKISAPTYYFNDFDITNKAYRSIRVHPNTPKGDPNHFVNYAKEITLNDGKKFLLYNINSNNDNLQHSYFILARYTTPVHVKPFKWDLHWINDNENGTVTKRSPYVVLSHGRAVLSKHHLYGGTPIHIYKLAYQGHNKKQVEEYGANTEYGRWKDGDYHIYYGHQSFVIDASDVYTRNHNGNNDFY